MKGADMFIIYADASNKNITLSPRLGKGEFEPEFNSDAKVTLLEGTGIANGQMTANVRCTHSLSLDLGQANRKQAQAVITGVEARNPSKARLVIGSSPTRPETLSHRTAPARNSPSTTRWASSNSTMRKPMEEAARILFSQLVHHLLIVVRAMVRQGPLLPPRLGALGPLLAVAPSLLGHRILAVLPLAVIRSMVITSVLLK